MTLEDLKKQKAELDTAEVETRRTFVLPLSTPVEQLANADALNAHWEGFWLLRTAYRKALDGFLKENGL
jgi:hypothetical protein